MKCTYLTSLQESSGPGKELFHPLQDPWEGLWNDYEINAKSGEERPVDEYSGQLPPPRPLAGEGSEMLCTLVTYPPKAPPAIKKKSLSTDDIWEEVPVKTVEKESHNN